MDCILTLRHYVRPVLRYRWRFSPCISKAAEEIGFNTIGGRLTLDSLITEAKLPCILHWKQNHFVVLYKVRRKKHHPIFYVADPGKGLLEYSERELQAYWISTQSQGEEKGIALLLEPTLGVSLQNKRKSL